MIDIWGQCALMTMNSKKGVPLFHASFRSMIGIGTWNVSTKKMRDFDKRYVVTMYRKFVKRTMDIIMSIVLLVITFPILLITAVLIRIDSAGPAIFAQERLGLRGKVFRIYKFRTMCMNAEHTGSGVYSGKNDSRVTKVGRILRATSIDELPQVINILKGEMSFIGPRPPLTYHPWDISEYTQEQLRMFEARPGITGWAQVNGRKGVQWPKRIELNVWYVDNVSFWLDLKILVLTVFKVLSNADNVNTVATVAVTEDKEMPSGK